jgi:hypothetical protein
MIVGVNNFSLIFSFFIMGIQINIAMWERLQRPHAIMLASFD